MLLVGGGGAGLRAAIAIAETEPGLDVAVISKVYPMRSHTVSAEGGAAGVIADDDSLDEHVYDTISGSDWLGDQDAIEAFVDEAPRELLQLEHWGCPWSRQPDGRIAVRPFGGMKKHAHLVRRRQDRLPHAPRAVPDVAEVRSRRRGTTSGSSPSCSSTTAAVHGVVAVELKTGRIHAITAKAVVLATGGCGKVFPFTTNAAHQHR